MSARALAPEEQNNSYCLLPSLTMRNFLNLTLSFIFLICFQFLAGRSDAQQLKLGNNPTQTNKSALLELESWNQGLRLTRVDTTAVNEVLSALSPALRDSANGMIVYQVSDSSVYLLKGGYWKKLVIEPALTSGSVVFAGNDGDYLFSENNSNFYWDNLNVRLGIGTNTPNTRMEVNSRTTDMSGLRLSQLKPMSPSDATGRAIGVNNNGDIVRVNVPNYITTDVNIVNFKLGNSGLLDLDPQPYTRTIDFNIPNVSSSGNVIVNCIDGGLPDAVIISWAKVDTNKVTIKLVNLKSPLLGLIAGSAITFNAKLRITVLQ